MKTVYKYPIDLTDVQSIAMPQGAASIMVHVQDGHPYIWAVVDTDALMVLYRFYVVGTGNPMPDDAGRHHGSFMLHNGALVFHVFSKGEES